MLNNVIEVQYRNPLKKPKFIIYPSNFQAVLKSLQKEIKANKVKEYKVIGDKFLLV